MEWACSLLSQNTRVLNNGGRRGQRALTRRDVPCRPLLGAEGINGHTLESHSPQKPHVGEGGCCLPEEGRGWSRARLTEETS